MKGHRYRDTNDHISLHGKQRDISSRFSRKSEANASEYLESLKELFPDYYMVIVNTFDNMDVIIIITRIERAEHILYKL